VNTIGLHRYSVAVSVWILIVVAAGSLITTEAAGLTIPDWPLAFGKVIPSGPLSNSQLLVLIHRFLAGLSGILVSGLTLWVYRSDRPRALRYLALGAMVMTFAQIVLGGADVLLRIPNWIGFFHAALAQVCLLLVAGVAFATSPLWISTSEPVQDYGWPSLRFMATSTPALVFLQIVLGALYRHHIIGLIPHIVGAMLVSGIVLLLALFVLTQCPKHEEMKQLATAVLLVMFVQVMLGVFTYISGMSTSENAVPGPVAAGIIAGHVAAGGILLVFSTLLGIQVRRYVLPKLAPLTDMQAAS
jgi:cytochrome c oxidase assembly protein subunit 15